MSIKITSRHGEPPERMLQRFKKICSKEGIFKELRMRRFYEKPSDRRRRQAKETARQIKRAQRRARGQRRRRR